MSYHAFISYSRAADGQLAPKIQAALHRFAKPWNRLRAVRVFRDQTDLAANPQLWSNIEKALQESEYFLFLASPAAAASRWVNKEIEYWMTQKSPEKFLILLTHGELVWDSQATDFDWNRTTAVPASLRGRFREEPLFVDLRWAQDSGNFSLRHSQFRQAILDIAAPLHGRPKSELDGEDVRQFRRTRRFAGSAILGLVVLTIASVVAGLVAVQQKETADQQRTQALQQKRIAEIQKAEAIDQRNVAISRELAAQAAQRLASDPQLSLLLALEAATLKPTEQATDSLRKALVQSRLLRTMRAPWTGRGTVPYIWQVTMSPDGRLILSLGAENVIRLWDAATGHPVGVLEGAESLQSRWNDAEFSPDARLVLAADDQGTTKIWEAASGRIIGTVPGQRARFSLDGRLLITSGSNAPVRLAEAASGKLQRQVRAQSGEFTTADLSPDSRQFVAGTSAGRVEICEVESGRSVSSLSGHFGRVNAAHFSRDGRRIVTASDDKTVRVWDAITGEPLLELRDHPAEVEEAEFNDSGEFIVSKDRDEGVMIWRLPEGTRVAANLAVTAAALSPDGHCLATVADSRLVKLWNMHTGLMIGELRGHEEPVNDVAFSLDGSRLVTGSNDFSVRLWNAVPDLDVVTLQDHPGPIAGAWFGSDGSTIRTVITEDEEDEGDLNDSEEDHARIYQVRWKTQTAEILAKTAGALSQFSQSGDLALSGPLKGKLQIFDLRTALKLGEIPSEFGGRFIQSVVFSPDGHWLVARDDADGMAIWDSRKVERVWQTPTSATGVGSDMFSSDGRLLAAGAGTHRCVIWEVATGHPLVELTGHAGLVGRTSFSPKGPIVLTEGDQDPPRLWQAETGKLLAELDGGDARFVAGGSWVITSEGTNTTHIWEGTSGRLRAKLSGFPLCWTPDGRLIAIGGDSRVTIWSAADDKLVSQFAAARSVLEEGLTAFSPDGTLLATVAPGDIRLGVQGDQPLYAHSLVEIWDISSGQLVTELQGHKNDIASVQFSPDGKYLLTACADHAARLYPRSTFVPLGELIAMARTNAGRSLTAEERNRFLHLSE